MTDFSSQTKKGAFLLDYPSDHPNQSLHWSNLHHLPSDVLLNDIEELKIYFQNAIDNLQKESKSEPNKISASVTKLSDKMHKNASFQLGIWSCIAGYCEALSTHKDKSKRFSIFPIPIDAINRLVTNEFNNLLNDIIQSTNNDKIMKKNESDYHRILAQKISSAIWARVPSKPSARDEMHSNSVYIALRGNIDNKTLDCFGATVSTIAGMHMLGKTNSLLTLSEDHAYESHFETALKIENNQECHSANASISSKNDLLSILKTCELAIPGNSKIAQSKRGKEISFSFSKMKSELNPQTSWLYMASNPVICLNVSMAIAAVISNINCFIEKQSKSQISVINGQLCELKRDLLWILKDRGCISKFPYAMMELGDCEEHITTPRGESWIDIPSLRRDVLVIESLYINAMEVSKEVYGDNQVYPYCCK